MNKYARMLLAQQPESNTESQSEATIRQLTEAGDTMQHAITELRDSILGPQRSNENLDAYRRRSHQALRQAEEIVVAQMTERTAPSDSPTEDQATLDLALINDQLSRLDADWTSPTT